MGTELVKRRNHLDPGTTLTDRESSSSCMNRAPITEHRAQSEEAAERGGTQEDRPRGRQGEEDGAATTKGGDGATVPAED